MFAYDGSEGINIAKKENPNLILLDIMLPVISGWEVCKLLRQFTNVPIIMLTAMDTIENKIEGLNIGADDYVVKPFEPKEVIARVNAHIRRQNADDTSNDNQSEGLAKFDNISIDIEKYEVKLNDKIVSGLKPKEVQLMYFLLTNKNQVFSRETLLEKVWGYEYYGDVRTVDVTVRRLREKIEDDPSNPRFVVTRRGVGYYFDC